MNEPLRVLIIDDSAIYRQMIRNVLKEIASVEVVGVAKNGEEGLKKIAELNPDAITLDYEMPGLNGIEVLQGMKAQGLNAKAIMVSSYTEKGAKVTTDALLEGALDFIRKPSANDPVQSRRYLQESLLEKLLAVADSLGRQSRSKRVAVPNAFKHKKRLGAVVIGSSTGGPLVLRQILEELPANLSVPVIIVQHMPSKFTGRLAQRLNDLCPLDVLETADGMKIRPGGVYIAAGGQHTKLIKRSRDIIVRLTEDPPENSCRPSIDYTLRCAAEVYDQGLGAIILTGMGRDGKRGCEVIKQRGGVVFAQHPDDCVVYGMPKAVIEAGLADHVLRINEVAPAIAEINAQPTR